MQDPNDHWNLILVICAVLQTYLLFDEKVLSPLIEGLIWVMIS